MTLLDDELGAQPEVAAGLLDAQLGRVDELRSAVLPDGAELDGIVLVARGSSDNAARYAQYLWSIRTRLPVALATPSLTTVYGTPLDFGGKAVVAISQSGSSPDVVAVLQQARTQGCPTLAITNDPTSALAGAAAAVIDLCAGDERSVAATKTYTASLVAVALVAVALGHRAERELAVADLRQLPAALEAAVLRTSGVDEAAQVLESAWRAVAVGRGLNLSTAYETALKLTELTGTLVAPYSPADLMHGPIGAVTADVPVLLVAPDEPASASVLEIAPEVARRRAPVIVLGSAAAVDRVTSAIGSSAADTSVFGVVLAEDAAVASWLTPVTAVVPGQLLAREVATRRGVDVDSPGGLSKVTLTT